MVPLSSLWLPIVLSAVIVFVASSILHMLLPVHANDVRKVPDEDEVMQALRRFSIPPGDYVIPRPTSRDHMKDAAFMEKMKAGPVAVMTVIPPGPPTIGSSLAQWFVYLLVVNLFAGYIAGRALGPGANYLHVFRFAGATAFLGYAMALPQHSIWYKRSWATTLKSMGDGLLYALLTAGTFGWLWPR